MARQQFFAGLDIGSNSIRVIAAGRSDTGALAIRGVGEAATDGVRKGAIVSPEAVAKCIQRAFHELHKNAGIEVDHAFVTLAEPRMAAFLSKGAVSVSRADGEVTREDVLRVGEAAEAALPRLANREVIHSFPLSYKIDHEANVREPVGLIGMKLEVETLFIGAFTTHIKNLIHAAEIAGITIDDVLAAPYAASFHALSKKQKEVGSLLLDIGSQTSALAVFEEGLLISLEVIPYGSGHITYDIGLGFQIDLGAAERVKRNLGVFLEQGKKEIRLADLPKNFEESFSPKKLKEIVSARLDDIFELVEKHLKRIDRAQLLPGGAVLIGGGAKLFDIQTSARENLHLPVEVASLATGVSAGKELVAGPEWAGALGLVKYAVEQHEPQGRIGEFLSSPFSQRMKKILKAFIP